MWVKEHRLWRSFAGGVGRRKPSWLPNHGSESPRLRTDVGADSEQNHFHLRKEAFNQGILRLGERG